MNIIRKLTVVSSPGIVRTFSVSGANNATYSCKLLVVGGGTGGCTMAAKFARRLPKGSLIVLEPSKDHYYQPLWTLVGAGVGTVAETRRAEESVLPNNCRWLQDSANSVLPHENKVITSQGDVINYEYLIIAVGLINDYEKVPGLYAALQDKTSSVSSIFSPDFCEKTFSDMKKHKEGNVVFTYPNTLIKCPGAPQKIVYLAESYFSKTGVRSKTNIIYNTCLPVIFGVPKYAEALMKVVKRKNINVNYVTVLKEVRHDKKEAVFFNKEDPDKDITVDYSMLHVSPPMRTPDFLQNNTCLVDESGFLQVDMYSLQNQSFPNVFGIGDCTNTPNSKTAAAIAAQCYVLEHNLLATMQRDEPRQRYSGYGACPLLTSYNTCILAEFVYGGVVRETMPFNQARESTIAFYMKKKLFPFIYWHFMLKGYYHGPEGIRKMLNPFRDCKKILGPPEVLQEKCKLLVVGGGAGGCSVAWRFARRMKKNCIIVLEPSRLHYYQPAFTLIAAGVRTLKQSYKPLRNVLPRSVTWLHDRAECFDPGKNLVYTWNGDTIYYEFMVVAVGIKNDYDKIIGLQRALDDPRWPVSTIYSPYYCTKTWDLIKGFTGGHALFTFPVGGGKCSGAAMKIMFLAQDYWRKTKIISKTNITYNTGAEVLFGVPKYATALRKVTLSRCIVPNYCADLVEITPSGAVFQGTGGETISFPYNLLHVTPPMSPPHCLLKCKELTTPTGYLEVDHQTLQHKRFPNVFGLGDCTCTPNSKTAAAVAPQSYVVERNLDKVMAGKKPTKKYNGYGACPLITSYKKGIMAEFLYDKKVWETFPFDQAKERRLFYQINKHIMPRLYWNMVKGKWSGPSTIRHIINPFRR
ncbi:uncharacterized protein LOC110372031 [Helicoverpa armigera]|uniref:uncharacterized protein LOC110372031 n=1 Tax=Helicoverpa armigera TaxID=29058 RepID=UPI00308360DC